MLASQFIELCAIRQKGGEEGDLGVLINHAELSGTTHDDVVGVAFDIGIGDGTELVDFETALVLGHKAGGGTDVATSDTADVEGTKGKLRTRLTDGLCGDDTDRLATLHHFASGQIAAIALGADTVFGLAGEDRTDFYLLDGRFFNLLADIFGEFFSRMGDEFTSMRIVDVVYRGAAKNLLSEGDNDVLTFFEGCGGQSTEGAAVLFGDDDVVCHVDQTAGEVTSVSRLQSGIGQTLTGTVSGDEVLQHGEAFLEVGHDGVLDNLVTRGTSFLRLCHQTAHSGELTNLLLTTTGARVVHHVDRVEALVVGLETFHEGLGELVVGVGPDVDDVVVTLVVGDKTHSVLAHDFLDLLVGLGNHLFLFLGDKHVAQVEGETSAEGLTITHVLDIVEEVGGDGIAAGGEEVADDVAQGFLTEDHVDVAVFGRNHLVEDDAAHSGADAVGLDVVAFGIEDGVALVVTLDLILCTAALGNLGGSGAVAVGENLSVFILNDLHKGLVGLDEIELVKAMGIKFDGYAGVQGNAFLVVSDDDLLGGVETIAAWSCSTDQEPCPARER